jgi:hypothetical protein
MKMYIKCGPLPAFHHITSHHISKMFLPYLSLSLSLSSKILLSHLLWELELRKEKENQNSCWEFNYIQCNCIKGYKILIFNDRVGAFFEYGHSAHLIYSFISPCIYIHTPNNLNLICHETLMPIKSERKQKTKKNPPIFTENGETPQLKTRKKKK